MTLPNLIEGLKILEFANLPFTPNFKNRATIDIWFEILGFLSRDNFMRAVSFCARTCSRFPSTKDIIDAAFPKGILSPDQAWEEVVLEMQRCCGLPGVYPEFTSPVICRVVASMGGLDAIWTDSRDRTYVRREFIKLYGDLVSSEKILLLEGGAKQLEKKHAD